MKDIFQTEKHTATIDLGRDKQLKVPPTAKAIIQENLPGGSFLKDRMTLAGIQQVLNEMNIRNAWWEMLLTIARLLNQKNNMGCFPENSQVVGVCAHCGHQVDFAVVKK